MTKRGSDTLTYDYENRLTAYANAAGTTTFVYDGDGGRVKKKAGSIMTRRTLFWVITQGSAC
jgi:YD repeat-containing protein